MTTAFILSMIAFIVVVVPLFWGPQQPLQPGSTQDSPQVLEALQEQILDRYLEAERQHASKDVGEREWRARREFLQRRYIDITRRLDYVRGKTEV